MRIAFSHENVESRLLNRNYFMLEINACDWSMHNIGSIMTSHLVLASIFLNVSIYCESLGI